MKIPRASAAGRKFGHERRAKLGAAAAAIFQQEEREGAHALEACTVDDGTALPFACDEARAGKDREVGRKGVGRHIQGTGEFSGRQAPGFVMHKKPEAFQPGWLSQGGKGGMAWIGSINPEQ